MIAAASITHERGFHMNPKNFSILLSCQMQGGKDIYIFRYTNYKNYFKGGKGFVYIEDERPFSLRVCYDQTHLNVSQPPRS